MNILVAYFSKFGNTQAVAEAAAAVFQPVGIVRLVEMLSLTVEDFKDIDLVVMGCPTYRMNLPQDVRDVIDRLPRRTLSKKFAAAYDTSYKMSHWLAPFTASKKLAGRLRRLGGKIVFAPETFFVVERRGPLYKGEIERASTWAGAILSKVNEHVRK